jgi:hypothetical protein
MRRQHISVLTALICLGSLTLSAGALQALTVQILEPANNATFGLNSTASFRALLDDFGNTEWHCGWAFGDTGEYVGHTHIGPDQAEPVIVSVFHAFPTAGRTGALRWWRWNSTPARLTEHR